MTLQDWAAIAQIAGAIATVLLAGLTLAYALATRAMVTEMRRARESTDLPYVVAYAEYIGGGPPMGMVYLAIENVGRRPAFAVVVRRTDGVEWAMPSERQAIEIPFLPAGVKPRRDAFGGSGPKISVPVRVEWKDESGHGYSNEFTVEWKPAFW